jgi:hypothetical protein
MPAPDPRPTLEAPDDDPHLWLEIIRTIFRFPTAELESCSIPGEMPPIRGAFGARQRLRVFAAMRQTGTLSSTLTRLRQRKAKTGCGGMATHCRRCMTAPSCSCRAGAQTRSC